VTQIRHAPRVFFGALSNPLVCNCNRSVSCWWAHLPVSFSKDLW